MRLSQSMANIILIPNIRFAYGHEAIIAAIQNCQSTKRTIVFSKTRSYKDHGQAITFRFKKDNKGWRVFV